MNQNKFYTHMSVMSLIIFKPIAWELIEILLSFLLKLFH